MDNYKENWQSKLLRDDLNIFVSETYRSKSYQILENVDAQKLRQNTKL
jgi:hypothetical protein